MITITYDFKNCRVEDLDQINALLATMKLRDLQLEDHKGYLSTTKDADGNLLHRRYGLSSGKLICEPAEDEVGYVYQIDTVVTDKTVDADEFLEAWRQDHPTLVVRIVITTESRAALAHTIVHHQRVDPEKKGAFFDRISSNRRRKAPFNTETGPTAPVPTGKAFDGALLFDMGYTNFEPGVTYILYEIVPNTDGLRPVVIFPHDDGTFESGHYTCTFVDRDFDFVPAALYYHPDHFPKNWINPALLKNAKKLAARKHVRKNELHIKRRS